MQPEAQEVVESTIYPLPQPGDVVRVPRCSYSPTLQDRVLVIDNGSYQCRAGWAGEASPRVTFQTQVCKPRHRTTGEQRTVVGEWGPGLKLWDFGRGNWRTAFDGDVLYNYEAAEALFDHEFDRLGIQGGSVAHPVLLTEPPLNPGSCRATIAELLFEAYAVPRLHFTTGPAAAFHHHRLQGRVGDSGLVVSSGHSATYVLPILRGQPQWHACSRSAVSGSLSTTHLQHLLQLRYPQHAGALTAGAVSLVNARYSRCADGDGGYAGELARLQHDPRAAEAAAVRLQLPWVAAVAESAEAVAARAARAEELRERLRGMAAARRGRQLEEATEQVAHLEGLLQQLDDPATDEALLPGLLLEAQARSRPEMVRALAEARAQLEKVQAAVARAAAAAAAAAGGEGGAHPGEGPNGGAVNGGAGGGASGLGPSLPTGAAAVAPLAEEDVNEGLDLLGVPDAQLDEAQRREKRRQQSVRASRMARVRLRERKEREARERAAMQQAEDAAAAADRAGYLAALLERHAAAAARVEARRRRRLGAAAAPAAGAGGGADVSSKGRRRGQAHRLRMKLIAEAAMPSKGSKKRRGGGSSGEEEGFGDGDGDWDVYKKMSVGNSDSEDAADDDAELSWTTERLKQLGVEPPPPTSSGNATTTAGPAAAAAAAAPGAAAAAGGAAAAAAAPSTISLGRPPTAEDYQLVLGVERLRCPELLLQPSLAGIDQAGVVELVATALARLAPGDADACARGGLVLTGGNAAHPGLVPRMYAELLALRPPGLPIPVVSAPQPQDCCVDAWRGAAGLASAAGGAAALWRGALTLREYEERGMAHILEYRELEYPLLPVGVGPAL